MVAIYYQFFWLILKIARIEIEVGKQENWKQSSQSDQILSDFLSEIVQIGKLRKLGATHFITQGEL